MVHQWTLLDTLFVAIIVFCLICGLAAAVIGHRKNLSVSQSFALGALLGPQGVASVVRDKPGLPRAPSRDAHDKVPVLQRRPDHRRDTGGVPVLAVQDRECSAGQSVVRYRYLRAGWGCGARPGAGSCWSRPYTSVSLPVCLSTTRAGARIRGGTDRRA